MITNTIVSMVPIPLKVAPNATSSFPMANNTGSASILGIENKKAPENPLIKCSHHENVGALCGWVRAMRIEIVVRTAASKPMASIGNPMAKNISSSNAPTNVNIMPHTMNTAVPSNVLICRVTVFLKIIHVRLDMN